MSAKPSMSRLRELSKVWVIVPAAGTGVRLPGDRPKQYREIGGRPLIDHSIAKLMVALRPAGVVVPLSRDDKHWGATDAAARSQVHAIVGGAERSDSVLAALSWLAEQGIEDDAEVLVHDAVRPCLSQSELFRLVAEPAGEDGALLAVPVRDTLKRASGGRSIETLDRESLWQAQTPQYFRIGALRAALQAAKAQGHAVTDEASAMELAGHRPRLIKGESTNLKVTEPADLPMATAILRAQASA